MNLRQALLFISTFLILSLSQFAFGQVDSSLNASSVIDSLFEEEKKYVEEGNYEMSLKFIDSAIGQVKLLEPDNDERIAFFETEKAYVLHHFMKIEECAKYVDGILDEYRLGLRKASNWEGAFMGIKGQIEFEQRKYELSLKSLNIAVPKLEQLGDKDYLRDAYAKVGSIYYSNKEYDSCIAICLKSLTLFDSTEDSYEQALQNTALVYSKMKEYDKALSYLALAVKNYFAYSTFRSNVSLVHFYSASSRIAYRCKEYNKTIEYAQRAYHAYKSLNISDISNFDFLYANKFYRYGIAAHLKLGNMDSAYLMCMDWIPTKKSEIIIESSFLSTEEKIIYLNRKVKGLYEALSVIQKSENKFPKLNNQIYEYALFLKNYTHTSLNQLQKTVRLTKDTTLTALFNNWVDVRNEYYGTLRFLKSDDPNYLDSINENLWFHEKELFKKTNLKQSNHNNENRYFEKVVSQLKENDLNIEFVYYKDANTAKYRYSAFLTHSESQYPEFLSICTTDTLREILKRKPLESEFKYINRLYDESELYELIWAKIIKRYPNKEKFYTSSVGMLNQINHAALKTTSGGLLFDKIKFITLENASQLASWEPLKFSQANSSVTLYGGISYDLDNKNKVVIEKGNTFYQKHRGEIEGSWKYLKETKEEVDRIDSIVSKSGGKTYLVSGIDASEVKFKKFSKNNSSDIIHIATHGSYLKNTKSTSLTLQSKSYTKSGLIMAGANTCYEKQAAIENFGDGVITAPEIASLNLSNTKLVVLSACESGLGQSSLFGNVYGLKKAFKTAGVDYVLYSLWKVSDEVTKEFMVTFYNQLMLGVEIQTAFLQTQKKMKDKHETFYWGAFQLTR